VVGEHRAGLRERLRVAEHLAQVVAVRHVVEVEGVAGQVRDAGAMGEHVADGDLGLVVAVVAGYVGGDRLIECDQPALDQLVDREGGDRLGARVDAERRLGRRRHLLGLGIVVGPVAAGVPDGAVEHDLALAAHADLDRGVDAGAVEVAGRLPDPLDALGFHAAIGRRRLGSGRRHRVEVGRDPRAVQDVGDEREAGEGDHGPGAEPSPRGIADDRRTEPRLRR